MSTTSNSITLSLFEDVVADLRAGKMIIMVDDADRENEGDLVVATEALSAEGVSFMLNNARGLICVSISRERAAALNLPLQVLNNNSPFNTPFAISVDHKSVASYGVTAMGRARTMRALIDSSSIASDFISPGHVFPLVAHPAGVLGRAGQTEGSLDIARIAGFAESGVICEILNPDGSMARGAQLEAFARLHSLKITSVAAVARYRISQEILVREVAHSVLSTNYGEFETWCFADDASGREHLALVRGTLIEKDGPPPLVRLHSECLTGDVFGSRRCDCGEQLSLSMERIVAEGRGLILYLRQEGRGIGLANKLKAYQLQDQGSDTVEANLKLGFAADARDFAVASQILEFFKLNKVRLLTNNPRKIETLAEFGIEVTERIPVHAAPDEYSRAYLNTKREKLGHLL